MRELLDPATVAKLRPVGLRAQRIAEGLWAGIHPSRLKGASLEFSEHKQYSLGDEIRHLDWKVYAKSDRLFIKQFEDETNIQVVFVVDTSGSMGYCSGTMTPAAEELAAQEAENTRHPAKISKLNYAALMASGLAYLLYNQHDAIGLICGGKKTETLLPVRRGPRHLNALLSALEDIRPHGDGKLAALCRPVLEMRRRKNLLLIFSDLFDVSDEDWRLFRQLRARGNEIAVFHLLDPFERTFPFQGWSDFEGLEGEAPLQVDPAAQRDQYLAQMRHFLSETEGNCRSSEITYVRVDTAEPLERPLLEFLFSRRGRRQ